MRGAFNRGVLLIPGTPGINYGRGGDHIQITPPYIITAEQIDEIVDVLDETLEEIEQRL